MRMAISGKMTATVKINFDGDIFHELFKAHQDKIPSLTPITVQNCQAQDGEVGSVGYILFWNYFFDGKDCVAKTEIIDIDEDKKSITYKLLEGDLLDLYKTWVTNVQVAMDGLDNVVIWTLEYEKVSPDVPDPDKVMEFAINATKDIETKYLQT